MHAFTHSSRWAAAVPIIALIALAACGSDGNSLHSSAGTGMSGTVGAGGSSGALGSGGFASPSGGALGLAGSSGAPGAAAGAGGAGHGLGGDSGMGEGPRRFILDRGHVDLFEVTYDVTTSKLLLRVKDDTSLYSLRSQFRLPEDVTIALDTQYVTTRIPPDLPPEFAFLGPAGSTIYLLDQTPQQNTPWPGWSSERLVASLPSDITIASGEDAVQLDVVVQGPGAVHCFMTSDVPFNHFINTTDATLDIIKMSASTHAHASWTFSHVGDYYLTVKPRARTTTGRELTGDAHRFHFHVGPSLLPAPAPVALTITGAANTPYAVGAEVSLTVVRDPPDPASKYVWYYWDDADNGYHQFGGDGPSVTTTATLGRLQYSVTLVDATQRVIGMAFTRIEVQP